MKLVRLARKRWEVLAVCDDRGNCLVLDFLAGLTGTTYQIAAKQMSRLLDVQVPKKLRVFWFYGDGAVIVCAVAFIKAERTPRSKVAQARLLQQRYREAKRARKVEIVDIEETEWKIMWMS